MRLRTRQVITCLALLAALMTLPAAGASASRASIKVAFESYISQLTVAEGHVLTAIGEYDTSKNATPVEAAIGEELVVLRAAKTSVKAQKIGGHHPRVRLAKTRMLEGLRSLIAAYEHLSKTYADASTTPTLAKHEYARWVTSIRRAVRELHGSAGLL